MRRALLVLAVMASALAVASGLALADTISGDGGNNRLVGTNGTDNISGAGGNDDIYGKNGEDRLFGDSGNDQVYGGGSNDRLQGGLGRDYLSGQLGNDFVNVIDGQANDRALCGPGPRDLAGIDDFDFRPDTRNNQDFFAISCEFVYVATGPFPNPKGPSSRDASDLASIDTRAEAEEAEAAGLLRQLR